MKLSNITLDWLGHSGFLIQALNKIIYIDPFNINVNIKADIILITHNHYDHCSIKDIEKIAKDNTIIIMPVDCQSSITKINKKIQMKILQPRQGIKLDGIEIIAVPAYNINKSFHPKAEEWNGYIITLAGIRIYHAGDTDLIPEMSKLGKIDLALLPIGGNYTMNASEAAEAASIIKPKLAVPIHWGAIIGNKQDAEKFVNFCRQEEIKAMILEKR